MDSWQEEGIVVDLQQLENQAEDLDLHYFADAVRSTRDRLGRYLVLHTAEMTEDMSAPALPPPEATTCSTGHRRSGPGR
jgi:hypothetical protein